MHFSSCPDYLTAYVKGPQEDLLCPRAVPWLLVQGSSGPGPPSHSCRVAHSELRADAGQQLPAAHSGADPWWHVSGDLRLTSRLSASRSLQMMRRQSPSRVSFFRGNSTWPRSWCFLCLSTWYTENLSTLWVMLLLDTWER